MTVRHVLARGIAVSDQIWGAFIVAGAVVIGGFLAGGRYTAASAGNAGHVYVYVVDRFTGAVWRCDDSCMRQGNKG